jgi:hypothetical protein
VSYKRKAGRVYLCSDCEQIVRLSHVTRGRCAVVRARARRRVLAFAFALFSIVLFGCLRPY